MSGTRLLQEAAGVILRRLYKAGPKYARAGVMLFELTDKHHRQATLLPVRSEEDEKRQAKLMAVMDGINETDAKCWMNLNILHFTGFSS